MPNLAQLIKQAYQLVMVQNQGPEGGAALMSCSFCKQEDEWGLRIRTKAEQLMADTA